MAQRSADCHAGSQRVNFLEAADAICGRLHFVESPGELFEEFANAVNREALCDEVCVFSWDEGREEFRSEYVSAGIGEDPPSLPQSFHIEPGGDVVVEGFPRSRIWVPLVSEGEALGVVVYQVNGLESLGSEKVEFLKFLTNQLSATWINVQLLEEIQKLYIADSTKLTALIETGRVLQATDIEGVLATLLSVATTAVDADVGCIELCEGEDSGTHGVEWGVTAAQIEAIVVEHGESLQDIVLGRREPLALNAISLPDHSEDRALRFDLLIVPLASGERTLGWLGVIRLPGEAQRLDLLMTVAELASNAVGNILLQESALKHEALRTQLRLAGEIQSSLIPADPPPVRGIELAGMQIQCDESGGDYYGFFPLQNGCLGLCVADATGHGIGAALIITTARALLRAELEREIRPRGVVERMNRILEKDLADDKFTTLFFAVYDPETRMLDYASAGHHPAHVYRAASGCFERLDNTGPPLGLFADCDFSDAEPTRLDPGDVLVSMTDGIPEAMNGANEQFGDERVVALISKNRDQTPALIIRALVDASMEFAGQQDDDITAVCLKGARDE